MSTIIAASVLVPLSIAAAAFAVDKIEQGTTEKEDVEIDEHKEEERNDREKGPGGLVDLSGGMLGML